MDALTKVCALCLLCFLCSVDSSRWFTWVVRVGAPSKILKPHSQISRLGMWIICFIRVILVKNINAIGISGTF